MKSGRQQGGSRTKQGASFVGKLQSKALSWLGIVVAAVALCCSTGCEEIFAPSETELKGQIIKIFNEKLEGMPGVDIRASRVTNLTIVSESVSKYVGQADVEFKAGKGSTATTVIKVDFKLTGNKFTGSMLEVSAADRAEAGLKLLGLGLQSGLGL